MSTSGDLNLPEDVQAYLCGQLKARCPANLSVNAIGTVTEIGGDFEAYGIHKDSIGKPIHQVFPSAAGIETTENETLVFECMAEGNGTPFDMHVIPKDAGVTILLLRTMDQIASFHALQQRLNEMTLRVQRLSNQEMPFGPPPPALPKSMPDLADLFFGMEYLVLLKQESGGFISHGRVPSWLDVWYPTLLEDGLLESIPYLDHFIELAGKFWRSGSQKALYSGIWQEESSDNQHVHFRARALNLEGHNLLIIECAPQEVLERQNLLQAARQAALNHYALQREVKKKEILLHCIVHDLRSPLTSMSAAFNMLSYDIEKEQQAEFIQIGTTEARRQARMIENILQAFKAEIDAWDLQEMQPDSAPRPVQILDQVARSHGPAFDAKKLSHELQFSGVDPEIMVVGEPDQLQRIFTNILENAVRHSPDSGTIRIKLDSQTDDMLIVCIEDEGPGVDEDARPHLFKQFHQTGARRGSIGLGLYFCKITLEKWNGEIRHYPVPSGGAGFEIRLRIYNPASAEISLPLAAH